MAKKKTTGKRKAKIQQIPENALPQNILPMGERVEEDKNIYISQQVYKQIHKFTRNKTTNESGGVLVGSVIETLGKTNIIISGFVEAKYCEATPTTLKFTHETWEHVHSQIDKKHPGKKILGWIHTHPDFGIFLSEYDKFIHENFFSGEDQVAHVVDPIQQIEGFYFWINGKLERCKGFYIYEKTGTKIDIDVEQEGPQVRQSGGGRSLFRDVMLAVLAVAVVLMSFSMLSLSSQIKQLEDQQEKVVDTTNQNVSYLQQRISALTIELATLRASVESQQETVEPTEPTEPTEPVDVTEPTETTEATEMTEPDQPTQPTEASDGDL